ncbi:MAG: UDP-N-acetylmuramoyl-L-alanine--D-glutamate ligase [Lachnospiraceae bacterium]|nr:UDP-N-acetylmuramoyl-L-alanine--D-glutamate ligase [Lachnospiraceae bacterium]
METVLVIGAGKSGIAACELLKRNSDEPVLFDSNEKTDVAALKKTLGEDVKIYVKDLPEEVKEKAGTVVLSPGVPLDIPLVEELKSEGKKIIGEIELAYRYEKGSVIAITGTNGKTTTTTLMGEIMKNYAKRDGGRDVYVVGNIGNPYTCIADETNDTSITVAEISSFQLETVESFRPKVSAILNLTPDHMNRHKTMANYVAAKERIAENQTGENTIVLNYDDALTRETAKRVKAGVFFFTKNKEHTGDVEGARFVYMDGDDIKYEGRTIINVNDMNLIGTHNFENVMAAVAMSISFGVSEDIIAETIRTFKAVEHRIEFVKTVDEVDYYNDSKGTNPDAAIKAVEAMKKPTILIGGGYDKQSKYDEWIESFGDKVKALVLIGQTADDIEKCARSHGFTNVIKAESLKEAVDICRREARPGYAVLLSPACASWGMFKNYEERGTMFKEFVESL